MWDKYSFSVVTPRIKISDISLLQRVEDLLIKLAIAQKLSFELTPGRLNADVIRYNRIQVLLSNEKLLGQYINTRAILTGAVISEEHEMSSLQAVKSLYQNILSEFETSIDDDEGLLKSKSLKQRHHAALMYRLTRKRMLRQQYEYVCSLENILLALKEKDKQLQAVRNYNSHIYYFKNSN